VLVNSKVVKPSYKLKTSDDIIVTFREKIQKELSPENIPLNIIFENDDVIVLNKPAGLVVHPAHGNAEGTLINALLNYFPPIKSAIYNQDNEVSRLRPGLVHRLDKDTSGVIIIAKNARALHSLSKQIQNRTVKKVYIALCAGRPSRDEGRLVNYLGRNPKDRKKMADIGIDKGKEAVSDYQVVKAYSFDNQAICEIEFDIKTGRTHQIRIQSSIAGFPVLGDDFYGSKTSHKITVVLGIKRQMLHAKSLTITLPDDNKPTTFEAPLPDDFTEAVNKLSSN
jgi:23S rRNA pseudouridine1911/1915/1917 synthase